MSEIIDRIVAAFEARLGERAGCYSDRCTCGDGATTFECKFSVPVEDLARAAIAALRQPTIKMSTAGYFAEAKHPGGGPLWAWYAMIDEALK